jgi:hypothetical protein
MEDQMFDLATYRPDPYVTAGSSWARRKGIPSHRVSVRRIGDHAHVINTMFDDTTLAAVVTDGSRGYAAKVTPATRCQICQPVIYTLSYISPSGTPGAVSTQRHESLNQMAQNAIRLGLMNIEVKDDAGRDVTFDIPAFCE